MVPKIYGASNVWCQQYTVPAIYGASNVRCQQYVVPAIYGASYPRCFSRTDRHLTLHICYRQFFSFGV
jgi:hypothetical protein